MLSAAKRQIIEALDDLPEQSLATVAGSPVRESDPEPETGGFSNADVPTMSFARVYAAWRSSVAADDLDVDTAYFDGLRDASYPVWSPDQAFAGAETLLQILRSE